jgi:hypothetical protein
LTSGRGPKQAARAPAAGQDAGAECVDVERDVLGDGYAHGRTDETEPKSESSRAMLNMTTKALGRVVRRKSSSSFFSFFFVPRLPILHRRCGSPKAPPRGRRTSTTVLRVPGGALQSGRMRLAAAMAVLGAMVTGCASLHHVEVGEMTPAQADKRIEFKLSHTGWDVQQAAALVRFMSPDSRVRSGAKTVSTVWQLLTFGPRTGEVTFNDTYADETFKLLAAACAPGRLVGFVTMRETAKYPVVSGEIVRVVGYCRKGG